MQLLYLAMSPALNSAINVLNAPRSSRFNSQSRVQIVLHFRRLLLAQIVTMMDKHATSMSAILSSRRDFRRQNDRAYPSRLVCGVSGDSLQHIACRLKLEQQVACSVWQMIAPTKVAAILRQ